METNPIIEEARRCRKAMRLAVVLVAAGVRVENLDSVDELEWRLAARFAKVRPPSDKTKQLVRDTIRELA